MKMNEIRALSDEELVEKVYLLKEELFVLRQKKALGQLEHAEQVRSIRKDIAKILTVQNERKNGIK